MAEVGMARARSHYQIVVGNFFTGESDHAPREIEVFNFSKQDLDIRTAAKNPTKRRSNFPRRESRRRHLVEQRLKGMVILAVNQRNANRGAGQLPCSHEATKAAADDDHVRCDFLHRLQLKPLFIRFGGMRKEPGISDGSRSAGSGTWRCFVPPGL